MKYKKIETTASRINKKGVSPLIATVILIGIAIVIFGIIFFWLRGMITEQIQKFGINIDTQCQKVAFSATRQGNNITVSNNGNIPVIGMNVKIKIDGKTLSKSIKKPIDGVISPGEVDVIIIGDSTFNFAGAQKRTIAPVIQGKGVKTGKISRYVCKEKAIEV